MLGASVSVDRAADGDLSRRRPLNLGFPWRPTRGRHKVKPRRRLHFDWRDEQMKEMSLSGASRVDVAGVSHATICH